MDDCGHWRDAISARADNEDPGVAPQLLDRHLSTCAACHAFADTVDATRGAARMQVAPVMPDLSASVVKGAVVADRASRWFVLRCILGLVGAQIIVLATPALLLGDESGTSPHGARHLGAFTVAYGVGLLVVSVRPARARTLLPVAQVLCAAIGLSALAAVVDGSVTLATELAHLPEVVSLVLLWMLAVPAPRQPGAGVGLTGLVSAVRRVRSRRQSRPGTTRRAG